MFCSRFEKTAFALELREGVGRVETMEGGAPPQKLAKKTEKAAAVAAAAAAHAASYAAVAAMRASHSALLALDEMRDKKLTRRALVHRAKKFAGFSFSVLVIIAYYSTCRAPPLNPRPPLPLLLLLRSSNPHPPSTNFPRCITRSHWLPLLPSGGGLGAYRLSIFFRRHMHHNWLWRSCSYA